MGIYEVISLTYILDQIVLIIRYRILLFLCLPPSPPGLQCTVSVVAKSSSFSFWALRVTIQGPIRARKGPARNLYCT